MSPVGRPWPNESPVGSKPRGYKKVIGVSTRFHSLPVEGRDGYLQSVHRAAADDAAHFVLVFAKGAFPAEWETKPNEVDEDELRAAAGRYWQVDEIRPAHIHAHIPPAPPDSDVPMPAHDRDEKGRQKLPAYLLSAHKTRSATPEG